MPTLLNFKGYHGSVEISLKDNVVFGRLLFIQPLINYEAKTAKGLETAFREAVESYIDDCKAQNIPPEKSCKGGVIGF